MPLQEEERLFIDAIRNLNYEAGQLQAEENSTSYHSNGNSDGSEGSGDSAAVDSGVTGTDYYDPANRKRALSNASIKSASAALQKDLLMPITEIPIRRAAVLDSPATRLDSAADAATVLASRLKHSDGTSNAQVESALSWMHAINQRPGDAPIGAVTMGRTPSDGSHSPNSHSDRLSACNSDSGSSVGGQASKATAATAAAAAAAAPASGIVTADEIETPSKKQCTATPVE